MKRHFPTGVLKPLFRALVVILSLVVSATAHGQIDPETVYAPPTLVLPEERINEGGVHFDLSLTWMTDYVFRGIRPFPEVLRGDSSNVQFNSRMTFDMGRLPHPYIGAFANVAETDPISRFQEIRPFIGFDWAIRPLTLSAGHTSYIYPDRDGLDTSELWMQITLDDSYLYDMDRPLFNPYLLAAFDYREYNGWYIEMGAQHEFPIPDIDMVLRARANVAYVRDHGLFAGPEGRDSGFQHWQVGLVGSYALNRLLNIPRRHGQWELQGHVYYTGRLSRELRSDPGLWGGVGIGFSY